MFDWWKRRQHRKAEIEEQEKRMREALAKLDEVAVQQINGHEVESIEAEVNNAADAAVAILGAEETTHA